MFTGLVQGTGRVASIEASEAGARIAIETSLVSELTPAIRSRSTACA